MDKLSKGKSNFETVLASQKCVFGKFGSGFYPQNKKNGIPKNLVRDFEEYKSYVFDERLVLLLCLGGIWVV